MRFFTREEADRLLPELALMLRQLQEKRRQLDALEEQLSGQQRQARRNGHGAAEQAIDDVRSRIKWIAAELDADAQRIQALGVDVKDVNLGLVDFPSLREGREVYLCWRLGEERVAFWHELNTGYASRQPIDSGSYE